MSGTGSESAPWTIARLLNWTQEYFARHGVESPRLCAEILLAHTLGCERIELYTRYELIPGADVLAKFRAAVKEAAAGRPIAHLTGAKEFFALKFEITPDVLIPRPETEVLIERVIHLVRHGGESTETILDVGTGSGCIAISLAKNLPAVFVAASDVSEAALKVARRNAERHGVLERIELRQGDLFEAWEPDRQFDIIVTNPPYVAESEAASLPTHVRDFEPRVALFAGEDGLDILRRLIAEAPRHLKPGGHLLTEVAHNQASAVRALLDESAWCDTVTYRDTLRHERVVHARRRASEQTQVA
jgi:release factor glutamine methyltransferase